MTAGDAGRLVALAAIWGGSFPFMRVAAPAPGPAWTAELRVLLGGLAFVLYFRLIADLGATRALTVTYLIPVFESVAPSMLLGGVLIVSGTVLVLRN